MSTDANARGARPSLGHIRGLDGIRALSVLAIIAFHTGLNSVPGGFYGVDSFFVLSGFLITSLLVKEWVGSGTIRLRRFWARRARRLLPALFLLVAVLGIVMALVPRVLQTPHILGDAFSTIFYASNWYSIHNGVTYFSQSSQPSPLLHTWSLAIEEQFYLVWPLIVLAVLKLGSGWARRRVRPRAVDVLDGGQLLLMPAPSVRRDSAWTRRRRLHLLFGVACIGSLTSAMVMVLLAPDGYTTRAYYGTDARAQALLVGAAISIGLTLWREGSHRTWFVRLAAVLGLMGVGGTAALWATTSENSTFAFSGGFLLASLAAGGVVLCCAVAPKALVVRFLELPPLPQWGRISYGVYLWYWPVLLVMSGQRLHWGVYPLFFARVGVTVCIAAISYDFVEMPIRRGALRQWRSWVAAPLGAAAAISAVFVSTLVPVSATELQGSAINLSQLTTTTTTDAPSSTPSTDAPISASQPPSTTTTTAPTTTTTAPPFLSPVPPAATTSKPVKVLLVGDSMVGSLGIGLAEYGRPFHLQVANEGLPGCSLSMQQRIKVLWYTVAPNPPCDVNGNADSLLDQWRKWVDAYNPDVVVYLGRGETFDQEVGGVWEDPGQPSFDSYLESRYRQAVDVLGARGAAVVLLTTPYYDSGAGPSGSGWPEDDPARTHLDNAAMRAAVFAADVGTTGGGGKVYLYDLNALVSPAHQYTASIGGINVRCNDGVHFSASGGIFVGLRLVPELAVLGQTHAVSSPSGAWPGRLPASTPPWYSNLPCQ
jgi:peptidoglycan/LPS O-acetylase OafA/YrhL